MRWSRSVVLVIVLGLFALPFLTVGCAPTQYGSQSAGGSTDYTGYQLALGLDPTRGTENLLPPQEWLPDRIGLQAFVLVALVTGQLGDQVLEEGRTAAGHVGSGPGYVLSLAALLVLTAVEGVLLALAARRNRARPALDSTAPGG